EALRGQQAQLRRITAAPQAAATYCPGTRQDHHQHKDQGDNDAQYVGFVHRSAAAAQPVDAVRRRDDVGDTDAVFFVHDHDFALGDEVAVHVNIHGFTGQAVKLDNGTLTQLQDVADGQSRAAQFHRELDRNVHDHLDVAVPIGRASCRERKHCTAVFSSSSTL